MSRMMSVVFAVKEGEASELVCTCGWTETVAFRTRRNLTAIETSEWIQLGIGRSGHGNWARQHKAAWTHEEYATFRAEVHLQRVHNAKSCWLERGLHGRVREVSGINEALLTEDQLGRYQELVRSANFTSPGTTADRRTFKPGFFDYISWPALAFWLVGCALWILVPFLWDRAVDGPLGGAFLPTMLLLSAWFFLVGPIVVVRGANRAVERWRMRVVNNYLESIGFRQIDPQPVKRGNYESDSDDSSMTKRQRDHLWYGDHTELDWRDRERGQDWGMDADTYVSNWLEDDWG